jgi:histone H3/H4
MPTTTRVQSFILQVYQNFCLDQACELLTLAEDAARHRHGRRVTLRDLRQAIRLVQAEQQAWAWTDGVA